MKTIAVAIPARMDSKRFPGKLLALYQGKEILKHVFEQAMRLNAPGIDVWVATDSEIIATEVSTWGGKVFKSQPGLKNGTERIAEFSKTHVRDFYINIQGDDPTIPFEVLNQTIHNLIFGDFHVVTPSFKINTKSMFDNPNKVKIVKSNNDSVLYFSRSPIPNFEIFNSYESNLDDTNEVDALGHIGVYGYDFESLRKYEKYPESNLETRERLEQLRFLENGIDIGTFLVDFLPSAVDCPSDLDELNQLRH